jgi:hypothetical protein
MNMPQCPCYNCITMPICRHKPFSEIILCPLIDKYTSGYSLENYFLCRIAIYGCLNPTKWAVDKDDGRFIQYEK